MAASPPTPTVKSAMRTLDLIEYVVACPAGVTAQEIAAALAIPLSSLSYLLATLTDRAYLLRDGRRYFAGPGLDRLRRPVADLPLADRAGALVRALRRDLDETASLFEPRGWELEAVVTETAEHTLRYSIDVGARTPLHCAASGKAFLAALPQAMLERYFAEAERACFTPQTRCDRAELLADLAQVREQGYARAEDEWVPGIAAIGVAVCDARGPIAALSVALPSSRFTPAFEQRIIEAVRRAGRTIEESLGQPGAASPSAG